MRIRSLAVALAAAGIASLATVSAEAGPRLSVDVDGAFPVTPSHTASGLGADLRLGYELSLLIVSITPEVGAGYTGFSGDLAPKAFRAFAGGRVSFGALLKPGIYGHVGYAHLGYDDFRGTVFNGRSAPTYDGGFTLDLTVLPKIDIGAHAGYTLIPSGDSQPALGWINAGLHVAVIF